MRHFFFSESMIRWRTHDAPFRLLHAGQLAIVDNHPYIIGRPNVLLAFSSHVLLDEPFFLFSWRITRDARADCSALPLKMACLESLPTQVNVICAASLFCSLSSITRVAVSQSHSSYIFWPRKRFLGDAARTERERGTEGEGERSSRESSRI